MTTAGVPSDQLASALELPRRLPERLTRLQQQSTSRTLAEATPWGRRPKHLIRDRDRVYGRDFRARAEALGIDTVLAPVRAPHANAITERVIGTLRRECLDHVIPLDERHLRTLLAKYVDYYNRDRPHRTLRLETPHPQARPRAGLLHSVHARPVLGGLHHVYDDDA